MKFSVQRSKFRVRCFPSLVLAASLVSAASAATNDLDVARQALRDGLWPVARAHAQKVPGAEADRIVLESLASESRWPEILKTLACWENPTGDVFRCYRALALAKTGEPKFAKEILTGKLPADPQLRRMAVRLLAGLALDDAEPEKTIALLKTDGVPETEDALLLAEAHSRLRQPKEAARYWCGILAATNASVRAVATAAANLGDVARLREVVTNRPPVEVRALATLRLGRLLLGKNETFDEGAKLIHDVVAATPDAEGAFDAAQALAAARLSRKDWKGASAAYAELLEIWPSAARESSVHEGLGVALLRQGRAEDSLAAFRQAEAVASDDEGRVHAAVRVADALAMLGRMDESTAKCREALARWPKSTLAPQLTNVIRLREREAKGRLLYREFRFEEAQKAFAEVAAGDALRHDRLSFLEILCLYGQGRDAEAETRARQLVEKTADETLRADVSQWLARAAYNGGRWREAARLFAACAASPKMKPEAAAESRVWAARAALAANDFNEAIALAAQVTSQATETPAKADALIVQGEALLELARFDEAVLVLDRAAAVSGASAEVRLDARRLRADALFAMGADNSARYEEALAAYRTLLQTESLSTAARLSLSYKIGIALEKLKRLEEASDQYYTHVVLAYRTARLGGERLGDEPRAVFARAAFRLADLCEGRGEFFQAQRVLELVVASDVPAAAEARARIDRIRKKGISP